MSDSATRSSQTYLLVPAMPAPNGRLHLGHIAGPYLRLDILARHLRRAGHRASIVCASDPYDSYIPLRAEQADIDPTVLARQSCAGIVDDLASMNIKLDLFVDPLSEENREGYLDAHDGLVARLKKMKHVSLVSEKMPYSRARSQFVTGSFLVGRCPRCETEVSGFFCEECGAHFQPQHVVDPRARWGEQIEYRTMSNLFFDIHNPRALLEQLESTGTPDTFVDIARRHLHDDGSRFRLTSHEGWGLPFTLDGQSRTLFGHGLLFAAIRFVGDIYARQAGLNANPFDRESGVITVNGFGIDNCVSHLVGIQSMAMADGISKPFERFLINHFYTLEGKKFSTSPRWAIWVDDIARKTSIPTDAVRYFLASSNPVKVRADFDRRVFLDFIHGPYAEARRVAETALATKLAAAAPTDAFMNTFQAAYEEQEQALTFAQFDPRIVCRTIERWVSKFNSEHAAGNLYWWAKAFALLSFPIMPTLSCDVWRALGHDGDIAIDHFLGTTTPTSVRLAGLEPVSLADLNLAMPIGMKGAMQ